MVSVATGHTEAYPLYLSIGNLYNNFHQSHHGGIVIIGFLAIAKSKCFPISCVCQLTRSDKTWFGSWKRTHKGCRLSILSPPALSHIACVYSLQPTTGNVRAQGCQVCRWAIPMCGIWSWSIYCWLSRTGSHFWHCPRLVPKVLVYHSFSQVTDPLICLSATLQVYITQERSWDSRNP